MTRPDVSGRSDRAAAATPPNGHRPRRSIRRAARHTQPPVWRHLVLGRSSNRRTLPRDDPSDSTADSYSLATVPGVEEPNYGAGQPGEKPAGSGAGGTENLRRTTLRGGAYLAGRELAGMAVRVLGVVVVTRQIGPHSYGVYAGAAAFAAVVANIGQMGRRSISFGSRRSRLAGPTTRCSRSSSPCRSPRSPFRWGCRPSPSNCAPLPLRASRSSACSW